MDYPYNQSSSNERENFVQAWHRQEKMSERIGAVLLLFAAALILVLEKPSPADVEYRTLVLAAAIGALAGGITLLFHSRQARAERRALQFLRAESHSRNANLAGMGAALLVWQSNGRPMLLIGAGLLMLLSLWLRWRENKINQYAAFFAAATEESHE